MKVSQVLFNKNRVEDFTPFCKEAYEVQEFLLNSTKRKKEKKKRKQFIFFFSFNKIKPWWGFGKL